MQKRTIEKLENGNIKITIPLMFRNMANRRKIILPETNHEQGDPFLIAIARGRRWQRLIDEGRFTNVKDLAKHLGRDTGNIASIIRLAMLSPAVIHKIISGEYSKKTTIKSLRGTIPENWDDQFKHFFNEE